MALTRLSIETINKSVLFSITVVNPSIKEIIKLNAASITSGILSAIPLIKPTIKSPPASTISGVYSANVLRIFVKIFTIL